MSDFIRCNKVSGVYWLKNPLDEINITIKIKPQDGNISLPKYEDYTDASNGDHLQIDSNNVQEHQFKWQQKVFSKWEIQRYADIHNCLSEKEISYHNSIKNSDFSTGKVFTYIHEDYVQGEKFLGKIKKEKSILNLESCMATLNLEEKFGGRVKEGSSIAHLFRSEENIHEEQWICMHVVFDNSEYNEDSLVMKQEAILLSLYHNTSQNCLIVTPDANDIDLNAYTIESNTGVPWGYQYGVSIGFKTGDDAELKMMLEKFHSRWEKNHKHLVNFTGAPLGRKQCYVVLEVVSAKDFEMDDLYIEYNVKVPSLIQCDDSLHGRSHVSRSMDNAQEWCFGHIIELNLEMDADLEPPPIQIILEVISTDWWGRHRTEGYCYLPLTLQPGRFIKHLSCSRPQELDIVKAESRRFFVGGCHLIKDLDVLTKPQIMESNYSFTSTGSVTLRCDVTSLSPPGAGRGGAGGGGATSSALLQDAAAVLTHYCRARGLLAAATAQLNK